MAVRRKASEIRAARKQLRAVSGVRRSVFYFMHAILVILAVGALCILSFVTGARMSNAYILVNEGMTVRAGSMLKNTPDEELSVYFTSGCVQSDAAERAACAEPYAGISISSYEYSLKIDDLHILPWQVKTYVDVVEQIRNIKGTASGDAGSASIPEWTPRLYRLHLVKEDGRWLIDSVELLKLNPKIDAPATPDPDAEPLPMVTPTPVPTPEPTPAPDEVFYDPQH